MLQQGDVAVSLAQQPLDKDDEPRPSSAAAADEDMVCSRHLAPRPS